ncbi:MAG: diguanylate cyclase [Nitrosomonadales bacterium]|nr:diguanylate cyclase [Nitrosomonadales bacterium]
MSPSHIGKQLIQYLVWLILVVSSASHAATLDLPGVWFKSVTNSGSSFETRIDLDDVSLIPVEKVSLTGGRFLFEAGFNIQESGLYVLDFKNTSIIGQFRHSVFDEQNKLVALMEGGIQRSVENPYFLRHGREFELPAGRYQLITEINSPFYLAQPEPYIDTRDHYRQAIKAPNALTLAGLGIFMGLGIYYAALALVRRRTAEGMYAVFILGNLLFNGSALLVFTELFGLQWIYLVSLPILFSNAAYIVFVMALLEIRKTTHPRLHRIGICLLVLLLSFAVTAFVKPNWALELCRYGVGVFLMYGLSVGIVRSREGSVSAKLYLISIAVFFVLGGIAISQAQLSGIYTLYIEHVGLIAVAVEAILLALVLSYQFAQLHKDKEMALKNLEHSNRIAHTDALTGLSNRYALDIELESMPTDGSLTFLDLDGLKYYNDLFGHARGDDLLRNFAVHLSTCLGSQARLFRIGGDEFAVTCNTGDVKWVESMLDTTIQRMHASDFEFAGVSSGSVHLRDASSKSELKHLADTLMYQNKRARKQ